MDEYIDIRLTKEQHHAYAKASRKRVAEGEKAQATREAAANKKECKFKRPLEDKSL